MKLSHLQALIDEAKNLTDREVYDTNSGSPLALAIRAAERLVEQSKPNASDQQKIKDLRQQIRELEDPSIDVTYDDPGDEP